MTMLPSRLTLGEVLTISGAKFRGVSEGSGGNGFEGSSSDCPVVQLRSIENGRVAFLSSTNWQTNSFVSLPVTNFPAGNTEVTIFVNGIPSASSILSITPTPIAFTLTNAVTLDDGSFQFAFTNAPGTTFSVLTATNILIGASLEAPRKNRPGNFNSLTRKRRTIRGVFIAFARSKCSGYFGWWGETPGEPRHELQRPAREDARPPAKAAQHPKSNH